jgi:hypothetical protein
MKKLIALLCLFCITSCSWFKSAVQPIVNDTIDCVKTEEAAAAKGKDVFQIMVQIGEALGDAVAVAVASGGDILAALDAAASPFITEFGEPLVACVAQSLEPTVSAGSGSGSSTSTAEAAPNLLAQWIAHRGWKFKK